ncbi:MAG: Dabb family protein [Bacteroidetes bacterium]|nr:MAG: Dabb family protein [Bacteroidota bacterium]
MKSNRRSFVKQSSLAIAGYSFTTNKESAFEAPFVHHVLFWLKDKDNKENYTKMLRFLKKFKEVKGVKFLHVGAPSISDVDYEASATDVSYTFSYLTLFDSKKDKEDYLKDPLHTQFFNDFKDVVSKVIIYDSLNISD